MCQSTFMISTSPFPTLVASLLACDFLSFSLRGPSPQAFTSFRRVGFIARRPRRPKKGNADGAEGIFGNCRMRVGYGPAPGPTKKRPSAILARLVGQATNTARSWQSSFKEEFCAVAFTLPSGAGPTSRGRSAFSPTYIGMHKCHFSDHKSSLSAGQSISGGQ